MKFMSALFPKPETKNVRDFSSPCQVPTCPSLSYTHARAHIHRDSESPWELKPWDYLQHSYVILLLREDRKWSQASRTE